MTLVSVLHSLKAPQLILVTLFGSIMLESDMQLLKTSASIEITWGIVILTSEKHPLKAPEPIEVIDSGITIFLVLPYNS